MHSRPCTKSYNLKQTNSVDIHKQRLVHSWFTLHLFATGNTDSANKVAEKLEELSVKDKASDVKKEEDKKETEKKEDEKKEVKAEEKNWEPRTCFADLQFVSFSSFSTIDCKWTEFGHLHISFFLSVLPQDHKSLMPLGKNIR